MYSFDVDLTRQAPISRSNWYETDTVGEVGGRGRGHTFLEEAHAEALYYVPVRTAYEAI